MFKSCVQECEMVINYLERFYHTWDEIAAFHFQQCHPLWKAPGLASEAEWTARRPSQTRTSRWWPPRRSWRRIYRVCFVWEGGMPAMLGHMWEKQDWQQLSANKMFTTLYFKFNLPTDVSMCFSRDFGRLDRFLSNVFVDGRERVI